MNDVIVGDYQNQVVISKLCISFYIILIWNARTYIILIWNARTKECHGTHPSLIK